MGTDPGGPLKFFMSEENPQPRQIRKRVGRNVFDRPPRISVVITVYDRARYAAETVDSAIRQKYREHEIIVVNDGSKDSHQLEVDLKMVFSDIVYIRQRHAGDGAARNTGIEHARGDMVAFLNAGDLWRPEFLASQYVFLERHNYDLVYCDGSLFGMHSPYRQTFSEKYPSVGEANFAGLVNRRCNVLTSGVVARKKAIVDAGLFETELVAKPTFPLWLRMAKAGARIGFQKEQLVKLRQYADDSPRDLLARVESEKSMYERLAQSIDLSSSELQTVQRRIADLETRIAVEQGNSFLKSGDYSEAVTAFRVANRHRPSLKLTAMTWLTRLAPRTALRFSQIADPTNLR